MRKLIYFLTTLSVIPFVASCSNNFDLDSKNHEHIKSTNDEILVEDWSDDIYFISYKEAELIANTLVFEVFDSKTGKTGFSSKKVRNKRTVPDKNNKSAYHIINYEEGGFVVISGDKREQPILAFSDDGTFNFAEEMLPAGVISWLDNTASVIGKIREESIEVVNDVEKSYDTTSIYNTPCEMQKALGNILASKCGDGDCQNQYWNYGPYINAQWNQWYGFNNTLDNIGCNSIGGRPPSGCVATAIGQVMRYHQHPDSYNWAAMPLTNSGSNSVSQLLEDIGNAVNMDYSCDGSGAETSDGATALRNTFGYSTASFGNWNHTTTKSEILASRPVILAGHTDKSCFLWWCGYQNGHAWVCEGYRSTFYCEIGVQTTHYYMNWGWGGTYNGYYAYNG